MSKTPILSYCTNVHPGESFAELLDLIRGPLARVRREFRPEGRLGAGLWLAGQAARTLASDPGAASEAREALEAAGLFAYTVNAFPIGGFHAREVKERVYRPTWLEPERRRYTEDACRALAALLPEGERGSVSTVPISYKAFGDGERLALAGAQLGELAASLETLEAETGRSLAVALEPEPLAQLETTSESLAFLAEHVFARAGLRAFVAAGGSEREAEEALRRRVGLCVDTCHLACRYEDLSASLEEIAAAGVRVVKVQLSSALELLEPARHPEALARLVGFSEPRYLHQTLAETPGGVLTAADLSELLDAEGGLRADFVSATRLRTHFHVPLCWDGDEELGTTRPDLERALLGLVAATDHLEVETYTFDVLPEVQRARFDHDPVRMIVAELEWVRSALAGGGVVDLR
ncbi:MAG: metabolite traffic protein EboE [Planctomycetes bacterium]|nr:metabolite traffic protein EboE [Planctomycetota bacterium]